MNIVRNLILSALGVGAMTLATPSHADVVVKERTYYSDRHHYHHHHDRDWQREHRSRVIINNDSGVSVAFGGHPRHHDYHHYHHRDWDRH